MSTNQGSPMTPHADLVARLRAIAARFDMTSTERYEQDAEAFYAATGYMAPGKDVPMAMGGQNEAERRAAHEAWVVGRNRSQQQAIQEAADALAALPPPADMNTAAEHYRQGWQAGHAAADPLPPRPTGSETINRADLVRYGVAVPGSPTLLTPMADGYWTPWHVAAQVPADPPALVALVADFFTAESAHKSVEARLTEANDRAERLYERQQRDPNPVTAELRKENLADCLRLAEESNVARHLVADIRAQLKALVDRPLPAAPPVTDTPQGWQPLEATTDDDVLLVRIGVKSLANAVVLSDWAAPFSESADDFQRTFAITDPAQFAREVRRALEAEDEDGSTLLTRMLDKAAKAALDDGAEGCEFDCVVSYGQSDPRELWLPAPDRRDR
mgnify:CR=1 FL=1